MIWVYLGLASLFCFSDLFSVVFELFTFHCFLLNVSPHVTTTYYLIPARAAEEGNAGRSSWSTAPRVICYFELASQILRVFFYIPFATSR